MIEMMKLPFEIHELAPVITRESIDLHYDKHYRAYVDAVNDYAGEFGIEGDTVDDILNVLYEQGLQDESEGKSLIENANQVINHEFFFKSLSPDEPVPSDRVASAIAGIWDSFEGFVDTAVSLAKHRVGSGWIWLVQEAEGINLIQSPDSVTAIGVEGEITLACIDIWEHAYYLDYQNRRDEYVREILYKAMDWKFVEENME